MGYFEGEECEVCGKKVTEETGCRVEEVMSVSERADGSKSYGLDSFVLCSYECLFKWAWDQIIPESLYFKIDTPRTVIDIEASLTWQDINEKKKELLKLIGILRDEP